MVFQTFTEWVVSEVLPLLAEHPDWHRLDGATGGGNRTVVGRFKYAGCVWRVHADTHFEPLLRAHRAITLGQVEDPFVIERTSVGSCLNLVSSLRTQPKHLYIYREA